MIVTAIGLACCCGEEVTFRGPTLIHANEGVKAALWTWRTAAGHCKVRCPRCRVRPDKHDKSAFTIMEWRGTTVEIAVSLIEQ